MGNNILVTGGAGYIGGSVVADFISRTTGPIKNAEISAIVRTDEQVQRLSKLKGVKPLKVDLNDAAGIEEAVLHHKIDIIVHTASSIISVLAENLIKALGKRRQSSGEDVYFIHTGVTTLYAEESGWPYGEIADTDDVYAKEKEMGGPHHVLQTNLLVTELAKEQGVVSFNVGVPYIYGRGTGEFRKLCINLPTYIRTMMQLGTVYKFDVNGKPPATHISDLVAFYGLLVEKILDKEPIPSGERGYYFANAHKQNWWAIMDRLAELLHARKLVKEPTAQLWPSYDEAADSLGLPRLYIRPMGTSTGKMVPVNAFKLGWTPKWDEQKMLLSLDDEIDAVIESEEIKPTIFSSLD